MPEPESAGQSPDEVAARIEKTKAETAEINLRMAKLVVDADEVRARIAREDKKAIIENAVLRLTVRQSAVAVSDAERKAAEESASFRRNHVFYFDDSVSERSARTCIDTLQEWDKLDPKCPIEIIWHSPGGEVMAGLALYDFIREMSRKGHFVTCTAPGYAASMSGILLQAGDKRVMGQEAWVLIHEVSSWAKGKVGEMSDEVEWMKKVGDRVVQIFVTHSGGKLTESYMKNHWTRKDWWLSSDDCLKLGIVDEVR